MASGSTLVRGAVIVTVMSWEYSLSPSSVNTEVEVSQLMLAGREAGNRLREVTDRTGFTITPSGDCAKASCTPT